jgi:hypothetical protein
MKEVGQCMLREVSIVICYKKGNLVLFMSLLQATISRHEIQIVLYKLKIYGGAA